MKKTIQQLVNASPFSPFSVHLSSGRDVEITHPEAVVLFPFQMLVAIGWKPDHTADTQEFISYLHVASVQSKATK